ncbi:hypothetical protein CBS101457_002212 [Exobasidium rhododendri]|nr:hypothetical protein CBS101457_002212 [Exobasidium rhododendri]
MPKSRFNAVRERARATRHNPVGRKGASITDTSEQEVTTSTNLTPSSDDVLPILKSLPLDDSAASKAIEPTEILWALTSLTSFLSNKSSRTLLLAPQHSLISRILLQLDSRNHVQIRDAASGCLRNLCIEAGGKIRKTLEAKGCVDLCISEIELTAKELGFIEGPARAHEAGQSSGFRKTALTTTKPVEEMNRKEKRLAAKANTTATKKIGGTMEDVESNVAEKTNGDAGDSKASDEHTLLCCSHLTNLIATIWCMAEVSTYTTTLCLRSAFMLSRVFSASIESAVKSIESLLSIKGVIAIDVDSSANKKVDIGKKDRLAKDKAMIQMASTTLNALLTLTDSDQEFSAAFVGVSKPELHTMLKGKSKKSFVIEDENDTASEIKDQGLTNLASLSRALFSFESLPIVGEDEEEKRSLHRQVTSLALLSMATIRNIQSSIPGQVREILQVPVQKKGSEDVVLMPIDEFELEISLSCLIRILTAANDQGIGSLLQGLQSQMKGEEGQDELSKKEKQAEEDLNNINLALEILAELAGDRKGWNVQISKRKEVDESITVDDQGDESMAENGEEDEDGGQDDAGSQISLDSQDEEMFLDETEQEMQESHFADTRIAKFFNADVIKVLLALSVTNQENFPQLRSEGETAASTTASLRSISIRALSVLNNMYLVLASFAQPPPSQPAKQEETIKSFHIWLRLGNIKEQMALMWRWQFENASRIAALPCLVNADDQKSEAQDGRKVVEIALCIMWSLSRCYEGVDTGSNEVLLMDAGTFVIDDYCRVAQSSLGVLDSLIAAYKSSKVATTTGKMLPPASEAAEAGTSFQIAPSVDGIRIHSIGTLSTVVRQPFVSTESKASIITLLADTLDLLPNSAGLASRMNTLQIADSSSMDTMIVAVNGVIDTFADETSPWDILYGQLRLQSRLKRASVDVRNAARTIDKRKQPALRLAADEAWNNLIAFLQYRDSLVPSV